VIGTLVTYADALELSPAEQDEWCAACVDDDGREQPVRRLEIVTRPSDAGLCDSCEVELPDGHEGDECACCFAEGAL